MVKSIKKIRYSSQFILLLALCLGFSSTLYGANTRTKMKIRERRMQSTPPADYICHKCGVAGHWIQQCTSNHAQKPPLPKNYICHKCHIAGHWVTDCPKKYHKRPSAPPNRPFQLITNSLPYKRHLHSPKRSKAIHLYDIWSCKSIKECNALITVKSCLAFWQTCEDTGMLENILHYLSGANHYRNIVAAYHHLLDAHLGDKYHRDDYKYINEEIRKGIACTFNTCKGYIRNQRKRGTAIVKADDHQEYIFLRDLMDTMHTYLIHGYDSGHRYAPAPQSSMGQQDECKNGLDDDLDLFDPHMQDLQAWQANMKQQGRTQDKQAKFQIKTWLAGQKVSLALLGEAFKHNKTFQQWLAYLKQNECDTDNILEQVAEDDKPGSGVLAIDSALRDKINPYIQQHKKGKTGLYGFGIRLYYWHYYRDNEEAHWKINPTIPYKDLYVPQMYACFKKEILEKGFTIMQWNQAVFDADTLLGQSPVLRKVAADSGKQNLCKMYDIVETSGLAIYHLLSIQLYTNFTALSSEFSASLGYLFPAESLQSIIGRNAAWHHLSKYLREVVEVFGEKIGRDEHDNNIDRGSFYHTVTHLLLSSFSVHCYGPLSTSKQLPVAMLFTHNDGFIVSLKQGAGWSDKCLKFFNVSLVSSFAAEDERLFIGGRAQLQIASIRLVKAHINTAPLMHTLFIIHHIIKGEELDRCANVVVQDLDIALFKKLLSSSVDLPDYMQQIWSVFRHAQQTIKIHMGYMYRDYNGFIRLLFSSSWKHRHLLRLGRLVSLFPNVAEIVCEATDNITGRWKRDDYSPSMVDTNFLLGLQAKLKTLTQHKQHKLKRLLIKTSRYLILANASAYATRFTALEWQIGQGPRTLVLTKTPYADCITKVASMVAGKCPSSEATSLDIAMWQKLVTGANDVPSTAKQRWEQCKHRWQKIKINLRYMHKYYALWLPEVCAGDPKFKNLLLLDKLSAIFPNVRHIICEKTDWDADQLDVNSNKGAYSPSIVGPNFIFGIQDMLRKITKQKRNKLKQITIQTYQNEVRGDCNLYAKQFGILGWQIAQKVTKLTCNTAKTINITKQQL